MLVYVVEATRRYVSYVAIFDCVSFLSKLINCYLHVSRIPYNDRIGDQGQGTGLIGLVLKLRFFDLSALRKEQPPS